MLFFETVLYKPFTGSVQLLTFGCAPLAALVSRTAQRAQVAECQRAVSVITARATGGNQLEEVLLGHEAARECPAT